MWYFHTGTCPRSFLTTHCHLRLSLHFIQREREDKGYFQTVWVLLWCHRGCTQDLYLFITYTSRVFDHTSAAEDPSRVSACTEQGGQSLCSSSRVGPANLFQARGEGRRRFQAGEPWWRRDSWGLHREVTETWATSRKEERLHSLPKTVITPRGYCQTQLTLRCDYIHPK